MIRHATHDDLNWLMQVAHHAYEDGTFDDEAGKNYWRQIMSSPTCLLLRGEKAVMGFAIVSFPFNPDLKFGVTLPICSLGNAGKELMEMTRMGLDWAKEQGAKHFQFAAITGKDLGPLAKRFGGKPISPSYRVEF